MSVDEQQARWERRFRYRCEVCGDFTLKGLRIERMPGVLPHPDGGIEHFRTGTTEVCTMGLKLVNEAREEPEDDDAGVPFCQVCLQPTDDDFSITITAADVTPDRTPICEQCLTAIVRTMAEIHTKAVLEGNAAVDHMKRMFGIKEDPTDD